MLSLQDFNIKKYFLAGNNELESHLPWHPDSSLDITKKKYWVLDMGMLFTRNNAGIHSCSHSKHHKI